jgi:hypothetical protein
MQPQASKNRKRLRKSLEQVHGGSMRKLGFALAVLLAVSAIPFHLAAQENAKPDGKKPVTLKVQVTFTETQGEKKVANLPYMFFLKAVENTPVPPPWTKVRIGSRVPVATGSDKGSIQYQYIDVGTNIDARAVSADDGQFEITFDLERSWVEGDIVVPIEKSPTTPNDPNSEHFREPIIRQFRTQLSLTMREGQTVQTTQAADPLSGKVLTITATINAVK